MKTTIPVDHRVSDGADIVPFRVSRAARSVQALSKNIGTVRQGCLKILSGCRRKKYLRVLEYSEIFFNQDKFLWMTGRTGRIGMGIGGRPGGDVCRGTFGLRQYRFNLFQCSQGTKVFQYILIVCAMLLG